MAMTPALLTRRSRRRSCARKDFAAAAMEAKELRSRERCSIEAEGAAARISWIAVVALEAVRAAR
jgi:hypothetical protein